MPYFEHRPHPLLEPYVVCYWSRTGDDSLGAAGHRVLPDGCLDIVFELGRGGSAARGAKQEVVAAAVGTMTRALLVPPTAGSSFVGVRFRPGRAVPFLGVPAAELTDLSVGLGELWRDHERLTDDLSDAPSVRDQLDALDRCLLSRRPAAFAPPQHVDAAVSLILRARGAVSIDRLGRELGVSRQHLTRRFTEWVGVGPKLFARVARFQYVFRRATSSADPDWSALALDAGYFDQAHFVGEFRAMTGLAPERFFHERAAIGGQVP